MSITNKVITGAARGGMYPGEVDDTDVAQTWDMQNTSSQMLVVQLVGAVSGTTPAFTGKLQESADGSLWYDIDGAVFAEVTASNNEQALICTRTRRYVRHARTITGLTPTFVISVAFIPVKHAPLAPTIVIPQGMTARFGA
jgi:hypothetical protein